MVANSAITSTAISIANLRFIFLFLLFLEWCFDDRAASECLFSARGNSCRYRRMR